MPSSHTVARADGSWAAKVAKQLLLEDDREGPGTDVALHDDDTVPHLYNVSYGYPQKKPRHLSYEMDRFGGSVPYPKFAGGVVLMTAAHLHQIDGLMKLLKQDKSTPIQELKQQLTEKIYQTIERQENRKKQG